MGADLHRRSQASRPNYDDAEAAASGRGGAFLFLVSGVLKQANQMSMAPMRLVCFGISRTTCSETDDSEVAGIQILLINVRCSFGDSACMCRFVITSVRLLT
jgi:hypothetical protein